jgi:hypothetical protein
MCTLQQIKEGEMGEAWNTHGEVRNEYETLVGKLKGRDHLEDLGIDGRTIKLGGRVPNSPIEGSCGRGNESSGSMKAG